LISLYLFLLQGHFGIEHSGAEMTQSKSPASYDYGDPLDEIAEILAAGLIRLQQRKSSHLSPDAGESSLDFLANQRGHPTPMDRRTADG
jgi:hypothetical protein